MYRGTLQWADVTTPCQLKLRRRARDVVDLLSEKIELLEVLSAKHISVAIVRMVLLNFVHRWGLLWKIDGARGGSSSVGRSLGRPVALGCAPCWPVAAHAQPRSALGCWAWFGRRRPFSFLKCFSNSILKQNCKINIKLCRSPKIVKPLSLGL